MPEETDAALDEEPKTSSVAHLLRSLLRQHAKRFSEGGVGDPRPSHHHHLRRHAGAFERKRSVANRLMTVWRRKIQEHVIELKHVQSVLNATRRAVDYFDPLEVENRRGK